MKSFISLLGFLSEFGEINIFKIFLFSSSCIGLAALLRLGEAEPGLDATEERLKIDGFRRVSLLRKPLGVGLEGISMEVGFSINSAVSELKDIWFAKIPPQPGINQHYKNEENES